MASTEEKIKHSKRLRSKKKERTRSAIAKELITSGKFKQKVVQDKRGKKHNLENMSFYDLVQAIQETEDYGDE